jgi:hypothetical protein
VEAYIDYVIGQTVSVSGSLGGPFTVTWSDVGPDRKRCQEPFLAIH